MDEAHTQFGADDTGSHEIGCDLLSADKAFPGQPQHIYSIISRENRAVNNTENMLNEQTNSDFNLILLCLVC